METLQSRRSIQEFWIDFLLEEEFSSDREFARAFVSASGLALAGLLEIEVTHSFFDDFGEADLVVEFPLSEAGNERGALLIENKITAAFQPMQAERYRARGEAGLSKGRWQAYRTVLVAPEKYIRTNHGFDHAISLEQISDWVCTADPLRREFKLARMRRAIEKKNTTGVQIPDEIMTAYRRWYEALIEERTAGFVAPSPRIAYWGDDWMEWTSTRLPPWCRFRHRARTGVMDLSFKGLSQDQLRPIKASLVPPFELCTIGTGQPRGAIQFAVGPIRDFSDLVMAEPTVRAALDAAEEMQRLVLAEPAVLEGWLQSS